MIGFIKKFLNSDFTKPLNTLIDEVKATLALIKAKTDTITADLFTSTHASRIDASISSRASQTSVDAIKAKTDALSGGMKSRVYYGGHACDTTSDNNNEVYTTKKTISGKGKLHFLMFEGSRYCYAKVIIDGLTVLWGATDKGVTDGFSPFGLVMSSYFQALYTGTQYGIKIIAPMFSSSNSPIYFPAGFGSSNDFTHISMDGSKYSLGGVVLLEEPLEFNTSLVIQTANVGANNNIGVTAWMKYELLT